MKQLLIILALLFVFASCDTKLVENSKAETTLEMQQQPKDTMLVVIDMGNESSKIQRIQLYDMNNEIIYQKKQIDGWDIASIIWIGFILGFSVVGIIIIIKE
jgi:uncharacterized lipoprotein YajG